MLLPLLLTLGEAATVSPADAAALLWRPLVGELLLDTLKLMLAVVVACAVLGTTCAWLVERTDLPFRQGFAVLAAVPLAIPPFITSYAWISISTALEDFAGAFLVVTCAYTPLVYLPVAAALRSMDPAIEESGRVLGLSPNRCFMRLVLPQLRIPLLGGALLVALNVLVEFGAFALLRYRTFTTELYAQYRTGLAGPDSSLLAGVLILLCLLCLALELRVRGAAAATTAATDATAGAVGRGTRRPAARYRLEPAARAAALLFFAAFVLVTLLVPLATLVFWLFHHQDAATATVSASVPALLGALGSSLGLGLAGAGLTTVLALPLGFLSVRFPGRLATLLDRVAFLGQGVPGIVVALALVTLALEVVAPLYQSAFLLVIAYAVLFLPFALVSVRTAFAQARPALEEAARCLGLSPFATAVRVVLPLAAPGLGAAAALVFVAVTTELTTTLLLAPIGVRTLATEVWADTTTLAFAAAAPYACTMVLLSLGSTFVLARRFGRGLPAGLAP